MDNRECHEVKVELANYGNAFCQDCFLHYIATFHCTGLVITTSNC